jgi:hypothetical protein
MPSFAQPSTLLKNIVITAFDFLIPLSITQFSLIADTFNAFTRNAQATVYSGSADKSIKVWQLPK